MAHSSSEPLLRSGHSLILSSVVTSSIGLAFWVLAAHRYRPSVVGADAVALTTLAFLSGVAQLNLAGALTRFVPVAGTKRGRFILGSYAASAGVSTALSIAFLCFATRISPSFAFLRGSFRVEAWWVISAIAWGVFVLEDGALIGLRRSRWVPIENAAFSICKLALVVVLASPLRHSGIFYAWTIATIATVIPLNISMFTRAVPEEEARAPEGDVSVAHLVRYVPFDYLASLAWLGATSLLPLLIVRRVGTTANAYYSLAWLIAYFMYLVSINVGSSLIVEASILPGELERQTRRVIAHLFKLLVPAVVVVEVAAPQVLGLFGKSYAVAGVTTLRLLTLSSLPFVITSTAVSVYRARRNTLAVLKIDAAICLSVIALSWVLLPKYGTVGAGWAWLVSQVGMGGYLLAKREQWFPTPPDLANESLQYRLARVLGGSPIVPVAAAVRRRWEVLRADRLIGRIYPELAVELAVARNEARYSTAGTHVRPSASDLTVAFIEDPGGVPLGVVKVPRSNRALADLRKGRTAIKTLSADERLGTWRTVLPTSTLLQSPTTTFALEDLIAGQSAEDLIEATPTKSSDVVRRALGSISHMHSATAVATVIDDATFATLVQSSLATLRSTHPSGVVPVSQLEAVAQLESRLRHGCLGRSVELSYVHGDFSPGNVMLSNDGEFVCGILDWGQGHPNGLPAIDVLSLIGATYCRLGRLELGEFVTQILAKDSWPNDDLLDLARPALDAVDIDHRDLVLWYWLEHVVGNLDKSTRYVRNPVWWASNIEPVLRAVAR